MTSSHMLSFLRSRTRYSLVTSELAGQVRLHVQVLIGRLDRGRYADDIGDGCGRRDRQAVGITHAELLDTGARNGPSSYAKELIQPT